MFKKKKSVNSTFGEVEFMNGWKAVNQFRITLWNNENLIYIRVNALTLKDEITSQQEEAYLDFISTLDEKEKTIEKILGEQFPSLSTDELIARFIPEEVIFCRNGDYGICIGDREDEDCAIQSDADIAISFVPDVKFFASQEEYLAFLY